MEAKREGPNRLNGYLSELVAASFSSFGSMLRR